MYIYMDELIDKQQEFNKLGDEEELIRRGAWTIEEDITLINYIAHHGEGRWNSLASCAGLKRTGKSCRLRWLNYLRPDVSSGNITLRNSFSFFNSILNGATSGRKLHNVYPVEPTTRLKTTGEHGYRNMLSSSTVKDIVRHLWIPMLVEKIQAADRGSAPPTSVASSSVTATYQQNNIVMSCGEGFQNYTPENSRAAGCYETLGTTTVNNNINNQDYYPCGGDFEQNSMEQWMDGGDASESLWFLQQQFNTD